MARKLLHKHNNEDVYASDFEFKSVTLDDYTIEMIGSTPSIDRDGECVSVDGWDMKNFKNNPVILLNHNYHDLPVAKAENVKVKDGQLVFKIKFPEDGVYPVADTVRRLYKSGFMNASSVGFKPKEWIDGNGEKNKPFRTYTKQELLELSLVTVPSNPEALVSAKSLFQGAIEKNVVTETEIEAMEKFFKTKSIDERFTEIDEELTNLKIMIEATKATLEENIKASLNNPAFVEQITNIIENKKFDDGYNSLIFKKGGQDDPKSFENIDAVIAAVQCTIKNTIERN